MAGPGFAMMADEYDWDFKSAAEFRQRHLVAGLARLLTKG
jgi:hypothetical protein